MEYYSEENKAEYIRAITSTPEVKAWLTASKREAHERSEEVKDRLRKKVEQIESAFSKKTKTQPEQYHQAMLYKEVGGELEVATPFGRIDILTDCEIIEVKRYRDWKDGLGQLLAYSWYYPNRVRRLHLFSVPSPAHIEVIQEFCDTIDVIVTAVYIDL